MSRFPAALYFDTYIFISAAPGRLHLRLPSTLLPLQRVAASPVALPCCSGVRWCACFWPACLDRCLLPATRPAIGVWPRLRGGRLFDVFPDDDPCKFFEAMFLAVCFRSVVTVPVSPHREKVVSAVLVRRLVRSPPVACVPCPPFGCFADLMTFSFVLPALSLPT